MKGNKIFGGILLILGILIILWGLYSSYSIFKGNAILPEVFKSSEIAEVETSTNKSDSINLTPEEIQKNMEDAVGEQLAKMFPAGVFLKLLNLISWSIFAWILITGGGKIAFLGIKMLK
ncbi:MAG: hypothetical protein U9Q96_00640 [Patescibacteria group bacterium]|nr:hypothetical protein [Patescibacteria group bacterium]